MLCAGIKCKQENSLNLDIPIYQADGVTLVTNLAATTEAKWQLKQTPESAALVTKLKTTGGIAVDTPLSGWARVILTPADTNQALGQYVHGLRFYWPGGVEQEIFIYVNSELTNAFSIMERVVD